jgi:putative endonuclease
MGKKINKRQLGGLWEQRSAQYLQNEGYQILEMNYRCKVGEIDIIAYHEGTYVFIEVKYRFNSHYGVAIEAVNPMKQNTIRRVANHYLVTKVHRTDVLCRFDVIGFDKEQLTHIKNAF